MPEARTVDVSALAVSAAADACVVEDPESGFLLFDNSAVDPEAQGQVLPVSITVTPSEKNQPSVSFTETAVGAAGDQWKAAGWTAVSVASVLLGVDPTRYDFNFDVTGNIDGPSAGGLLTVGVIAGILGDDVRADAAMTGTISPDGSIGPVGGIPQKIEGAAAGPEDGEPKQVVFVPGGQANDLNFSTCEFEDVRDVGERENIEVQQVNNIYEAYEMLTGEPLPRPQSTGAAELPSTASGRLAALTQSWLGRYQQAVDRFFGLPEDIQSFYLADVDTAAANADRALSFLDEGQNAVAYDRALSAAVLAETVVQTATLDQVYLEQGANPLIAQLDALAGVGTQVVASTDRLEAETPRTLSDVLTLIDAYSNIVIAQQAAIEGDIVNDDITVLIDDINAGTVPLDEGEAELINLIFGAASQYITADFYLEAAENNLDYGLGFGQAAPPNERALQSASALLRQAAEANVAFLDTLGDFSGDPNYDVASFTLGVSIPFFEDELEDPQRSIAILGGALSAWATSSLVVAQDSYGIAEVDEFGNITRFTREAALTEALDFARERAEELLGVVEDEEPVSAIYYHEVARSYREGGAQDKSTALFYDWQATALSQLVAYFNGDFDEAISAEPAGESPLWRWGGRAAAAEEEPEPEEEEPSPEEEEEPEESPQGTR